MYKSIFTMSNKHKAYRVPMHLAKNKPFSVWPIDPTPYRLLQWLLTTALHKSIMTCHKPFAQIKHNAQHLGVLIERL